MKTPKQFDRNFMQGILELSAYKRQWLACFDAPFTKSVHSIALKLGLCKHFSHSSSLPIRCPCISVTYVYIYTQDLKNLERKATINYKIFSSVCNGSWKFILHINFDHRFQRAINPILPVEISLVKYMTFKAYSVFNFLQNKNSFKVFHVNSTAERLKDANSI